MKALVQRDLTGPDGLEWSEVDDPGGDARIVLDVRAAGVCYPDLLMTRGQYQAAVQPPFVPGSEVAGVVVSAPPDAEFAVGQAVLAVPGVGGYAERLAVPSARVLPMPPELDFAQGAAMLANHQTVHFALTRRAGLLAEERVLVLGSAGGVGSAAIQIAKALGARVLAGVRRSGTEEFLRGLGADAVVPLAEGWPGRVRELTGGSGVDVVVDPVGGAVFDDAVRVLAPEGRLVVLGFAGGAIPVVKVNRLLLRNVSVVGAGWGEFLRTKPAALRETADALAKLVAGGLRPPVTATYPLARGAEALRDLAAGKIIGKAVLVTG
ncbi:NADPH:quinone oxidoreductase family protein [Amycolatopsis sp. NPDC049691]|uniref:NADPH:quinone oxidoreductase family protein n=1 Tax=Amycolatopsis sp. NPDC049691 TaxID=3155155 RepID=UPI00341B81F1